MLANIRYNQDNERHRLEAHKATNEYSHYRMLLNSLMETVLFMVVDGFQMHAEKLIFLTMDYQKTTFE